MQTTIQKEVKQVVPTKTLKLWKIKKQRGDVGQIIERAGVTQQAVADAFLGFAKPSLIEVINNYYGI